MVSCGFSVVIVQEATEPFTTVHRTIGVKLHKLRSDDFVLESLMVSLLVIMFSELRNRFSQGRFPKQDQVVQTRLLDRTNETFGISIQVGRPRREPQGFHTSASQGLPKLLGEQR